eukprot:scaffold3591_cov159-Amphora_coffeaeformis.AAC.4
MPPEVHQYEPRTFGSRRQTVIFVVMAVSQISTLWWASSSTLQQNREVDMTNSLLSLKGEGTSGGGEPCPTVPAKTANREGSQEEEKEPSPSSFKKAAVYDPKTSPFQANGIVDSSITCDEIMDHFHRLNYAFHHHDSLDGTAPPPPLINYAFYQGQGFGRLVDHSAAHCLLSLGMDRPCLIDLSDRDPFYTWRSFIHTGTYDWELDKDELKPLAHAVQTAVAALPKQGLAEWESPVPHTDNLHLMEKFDQFQGRSDRGKYFVYLKHLRPENLPKALLSANWGPWFPNLQSPSVYGTCSHKELTTRIQNAMYKPTPLSYKLHDMRRYQVMKPPLRPYGAIHIRFVIMDMNKMKVTDDELLTALEQCIRAAQERTNLSEWWLISDKPSKAIAIVDRMPADMKIYYSSEMKNATGFANHSNNPSARGLFGHANMLDSVLDWMVLHESQATIITKATSYGISGARGRGKVPDACAGAYELFT